MENKDSILTDILPDQAIFALDIGTRSIIGMVGVPDGDRIRVVAVERAEHTKRAMIDGQIEDIDQVAKIAGQVKDKLEKKLGCRLTKVCVAAAGRALRTESVTYEMELPRAQRIDAEAVSRLEAGAISEAENIFMEKEGRESDRQFYLVGYTVCKYYLDNYIISNLIDHHGRVLKADIIATFLPTEVVESLYASMRKIDLEVASLTLEPIAAINAAIPQNIRLLNLAMVDIGAGTSDIAVCRDGSITGYTMAILAGDEITETIMREYLVDFDTAEKIKSEIDDAEQLRFTDILGFEQTITRDAIFESIKQASSRLCEEISTKIVEANGGMPSAVFLAGGGSRLSGLKEGIVEHLQIDPKRVAIAGNNFKINAFSEDYDLDNPEYATPLGIVISAGLNMINDSFRVILNDRPAKLFRSGTFTVMDILMMNGYNYQDMIGRSGQNLAVHVNGQRQMFYGEKAEPSILKLNGKESQLSDQVNPGDKIDFIPARHGKNASAQLFDIVKITEDKRVLLNGQVVEGDLPLKSGDIIVVENLEPELKEQEFISDWESDSGDLLENYRSQDGQFDPEEQENVSLKGFGAEAGTEETMFGKLQTEPAAPERQQQSLEGEDAAQNINLNTADTNRKIDSMAVFENEIYGVDSNRNKTVLSPAFADQPMEQGNDEAAFSNGESFIREPEDQDCITDMKKKGHIAEPNQESYSTERKKKTYITEPNEEGYSTERKEKTYIAEPNEESHAIKPKEKTYITEPGEESYSAQPKEKRYIVEPNQEIHPTESKEKNNVAELNDKSHHTNTKEKIYPAKPEAESYFTQPKEESHSTRPKQKDHSASSRQPYEETSSAMFNDELRYQEAEPEPVVLRSEPITYKEQSAGQRIKTKEPETQQPDRFREMPFPQHKERGSEGADPEVTMLKQSRGNSQAETGRSGIQDPDQNRTARRRHTAEESPAVYGQPEEPASRQPEFYESKRKAHATGKESERNMDFSGLSASSQIRRTVQEAAPLDNSSSDSKGKITFYLNDKPLLLPLKPEGKRYRLMDLLEYSGLDFKKVTGPVVLEVNGENGYFQQELKAGDHIKIYEKD